MKLNFDKIIDLSHKMIPNEMPDFKLEVKNMDIAELYPQYSHAPGIWYIVSDITMSSHCGTHIEFPFHHMEHGMSAGDFPFSQLIGEGVVLDFTDKKINEPIHVEDIRKYESRIQKHDIIFLNTGMYKKFGEPGWDKYPYLTVEAMAYLLSFEPKVLGTDAATFEVPGEDEQPDHHMMFQKGVAMLESLTNLDAVGEARALFIIACLPVVRADSVPVRVAAFLPGSIEL